MIALDVQDDVRKLAKQLRNFQRKQIPFATAGALTSTAFDVRKHIVERVYPRSFEVRNRSFARAAFRVKKAHKRKLVAEVYDRLNRAFLPLQAEGGMKRPFQGSNLAIPVNIKRLKSGKISQRNKARNLPRSFVADLRGRGPAIWQRVGRKGKKLKLAYELEPRARIKKAFPFYEESERTADRRFRRNMDRSLARALRTAR